MTKSEIKEHCSGIRMILINYLNAVAEAAGAEKTKLQIIKAEKSSHIRIDKNLIPTDFIEEILLRNEEKNRFHYAINFCRSDSRMVDVIIPSKTLLLDGFGIMCFFFRELLQYWERKNIIKNHKLQHIRGAKTAKSA